MSTFFNTKFSIKSMVLQGLLALPSVFPPYPLYRLLSLIQRLILRLIDSPREGESESQFPSPTERLIESLAFSRLLSLRESLTPSLIESLIPRIEPAAKQVVVKMS